MHPSFCVTGRLSGSMTNVVVYPTTWQMPYAVIQMGALPRGTRTKFTILFTGICLYFAP